MLTSHHYTFIDKLLQDVFRPWLKFPGMAVIFSRVGACWVLERTSHRGFLGATLGTETFTDLDCADDVALLSEMLEVLLHASTGCVTGGSLPFGPGS